MSLKMENKRDALYRLFMAKERQPFISSWADRQLKLAICCCVYQTLINDAYHKPQNLRPFDRDSVQFRFANWFSYRLDLLVKDIVHLMSVEGAVTQFQPS